MNLFKPLRRAAARFARARRGLAGIEFAFIAPFLVLLVLGTADLTFYMRIKLKLESAAITLAQVTTQYDTLYAGDFTTLFQAAQLAAGTVSVTGNFAGTVISCITNVSGAPVIAWQQISPGSPFQSQFGLVGSTPTLPNNYTPPIGATLIVTELYTPASPWVFSASIMSGSFATTLGSVAFYEPRLTTLSSIIAGNRP